MSDFLALFHKRITSALADGSTWAALAAVITGAAVVPQPLCWVVMGLGCMGVILKGGNSADKGGKNVGMDKDCSQQSGDGDQQ